MEKWNIKSFWGRKKAWIYAMFLVDHNFTNLFRFNFHEISKDIYRSSQPTMWQLKRIKEKYNIKTIVNLKDANRNCAYFLFEEEKCKELGLELINVNIRSRAFPKYEQILKYKEVMENMEGPVLIHCKAGADRTGIFCTLYQYFIEKKQIKETNQLKFWPYGHVKYSDAGRIDYYFEQFAKYQEKNPDVDLLTWAKNIVNLDELEKNFVTNPIANFINNKLLKRE
jgi:protein tyrosine/serine phosphatase